MIKELYLRIKDSLKISPRQYKFELLRILVYVGFALLTFHYIVQTTYYALILDYKNPLVVDVWGLLGVFLGFIIVACIYRRRYVSIATHLFLILIILTAYRSLIFDESLAIPIMLLTLSISFSGILLHPGYTVVYGLVAFLLFWFLGLNQEPFYQRINFTIILGSLVILLYIVAKVIDKVFADRRRQNMDLMSEISDRKQIEALLVRRNSELGILNSIGQTLSSSLDVDKVLFSMLEDIKEQREVYSATVWLVDRQTDENVCRQVSGPARDIEALLGVRLKNGQGIVGKAIATGESSNVGEAMDDPNYLPSFNDEIGISIKSILTVPIKYESSSIGAIQLVHEEKDYFNEDDVTLVESIANMAATSVENAYLHEDLKIQLARVKIVDAALKESDDKFRILAESTSTGIILIHDHDVLYANPAVIQMLNCTEEQFYSEKYMGFIHPDHQDIVKDRIKKRLLGEDVPSRYEVKFVKRGGGEILGDISVDVVEIDKRPATLATIIDITKYKKSKEKLERATKIAEESLKTKQEFLANISHEIRTPLNAIVGMSEMLNENPSEAMRDEYINVINTSTSNLLSIINDLLDFSKMEAGKLSLHEANFEIRKVVKEVEQLFFFQTQQKELSLTTSVADDIPNWLIGDEFRLKQMLINLIDNAVKFTEEGGIDVVVSLSKTSKSLIEIKFEISDTGCGIPVDKQGKIFYTFEQISNQSRRTEGIGLGLPIVKSLVELHGGTISVESEVGEGTKFTFTARYVKASIDKEINEEVMVIDSGGKSIAGVHVLLVEDNKVNQIVALNLLKKLGATAEISSSGEMALEALSKRSFDLILLDIELPTIDGFEVVRRLRRDGKPEVANLPVIALTAHAIPEMRKRVSNAGMDGYVTKPFKSEELRDVIFTCLSTKKESPIDLTYLISATNNDMGIMKEMIKEFFIQMEELFIEFDRLLAANDYLSISKIAHQIKPSSAYMGINRMRNSVISLEELAKRKHPDHNRVSALIADIKTSYNESKPHLIDFYSSGETSNEND